jgi:hypothetical protein
MSRYEKISLVIGVVRACSLLRDEERPEAMQMHCYARVWKPKWPRSRN